MKTLETYLKENFEKNISEHSVGVFSAENGEVRFYIHPQGKNGDTLDFVAKGNSMEPIRNPRHLVGLDAQEVNHTADLCFLVLTLPNGESVRVDSRLLIIDRTKMGEYLASHLADQGIPFYQTTVLRKNIQDSSAEGLNAQDFKAIAQPGESAKPVPENPENEQFRSVAN